MSRACPRMLLIGARGFLGGHLAALAAGCFECIAASRGTPALSLDITDAADVGGILAQVRPDVVVLTAALSDIDECERMPAVAYRTNAEGPANVARECARVGARLLFTCSGAVFDGEAEQYVEDSVPNPLSIYGKTKAEAERIVTAECPEAAVVRLSLILGAGLSAGTNSWSDKLYGRLQAGETVRVAADEYRNAIDVETTAQWILDLAAARGATGIFHLGSNDALSRLEIARRLAAQWGYSPDSIVPAGAVEPDRAPRGRYHMLRPRRIAECSRVPVPTCREAIQRCVYAVA